MFIWFCMTLELDPTYKFKMSATYKFKMKLYLKLH